MPLCEDGEDVAVTADNRREYVDAYVKCILNTSIEKQVRARPSHNASQHSALLPAAQPGIFWQRDWKKGMRRATHALGCPSSGQTDA
jgi:hypothetical protein